MHDRHEMAYDRGTMTTFDETPLDLNFIVEPDAPDEMSGGLTIPEGSRELKYTGTVVAIGREVKEPLAVGVRVRWHYTPSSVIRKDKAVFYVMSRGDIATIL